MISAEVTITVPFYDLDPMQVVWHGNYVRYLEEARCALLDRLGYSYPQMEESGYLWPVVDLRLKYVRPARFGQKIRVIATLVEYENRLRLAYRILDDQTGEILTKAETIQLAVVAASRELCLETPAALRDRVQKVLG